MPRSDRRRSALRELPGKVLPSFVRHGIERIWKGAPASLTARKYEVTPLGAAVARSLHPNGVEAKVPTIDPTKNPGAAQDTIRLDQVSELEKAYHLETEGPVLIERGVHLTGTADRPVVLKARGGMLIIRKGSTIRSGEISGSGTFQGTVDNARVDLAAERALDVFAQDGASLRIEGEAVSFHNVGFRGFRRGDPSKARAVVSKLPDGTQQSMMMENVRRLVSEPDLERPGEWTWRMYGPRPSLLGGLKNLLREHTWWPHAFSEAPATASESSAAKK